MRVPLKSAKRRTESLRESMVSAGPASTTTDMECSYINQSTNIRMYNSQRRG